MACLLRNLIRREGDARRQKEKILCPRREATFFRKESCFIFSILRQVNLQQVVDGAAVCNLFGELQPKAIVAKLYCVLSSLKPYLAQREIFF